MKHYLKIFIFLLFVTTKGFSLGASSIWIEPIGGKPSEKYYVGQTVPLQIRVDTFGEKITGVTAYITLDTRYVRIIPQLDGFPFQQGNFFPSNPDQNGYNDDTPENPDANGIDGLQLDYFQQTAFAVGGVREYKKGSGILAYFNIQIVGIPDNEDHEYAIDYDNDFIHVRQTGYYLHGKAGQRQDFNHKIPFIFDIFGGDIEPPLPDTVIGPGDNFDYYLGNHFFAEEFDKSDAVWSFEIVQNVAGVTVELDTTNNADMIHITTLPTSKGLLKLEMTLGIEGSSFQTRQIWNISIGFPPKFTDPLPEIVIFEDVESPMAISSIIIDEDDSVDNLVFRVETDSLVTVTRDGNLFRLLGAENWYGETSFTLFATDNTSPEISKEIPVTIMPVNDQPIIDFTPSDLIINDTLKLHHDDTLVIALPPLVTDVDDSVFIWSHSTDEKLDMTITDDTLSINVGQSGTAFYGNIPITMTAYDDEFLDGNRILNVLVKSYSPMIDSLGPILMHADSTKKFIMDDYVYDKDTHIENLTFSFSVIDSTTKNVDNNVFPSFEPSSRELSISASNGHNANNYLVIEVEDDDGNKTTKNEILIVVDSYAPKIIKIPPVVVYQDSTEILNLDKYVFDVRYKSADLIMTVTGNDIFESVEFEENTHQLVFDAFADVFGVDTLQLEVENADGLKSQADIYAYCIPKDNKPILFDVADLELFWRGHYEWLDLDDIVFDAFTPDSALVWDYSYSDDLFTLIVDEDNYATILTNQGTGIGNINLSVTNKLGYTTEKTIKVTVSKDTPPVWDSFQDIYLVKTQPEVKKMEWLIFDKCIDNETPSIDLEYDVEYNSSIIDVGINNITGEVAITLRDTSQTSTSIKFIAEDLNGNVSESQLIDVFIGDGLPPQWKTIPTIYMKNTEVFTDLRLLDYCNDTDDNTSDLRFTALVNNTNIEVVVDTVTTYVTITPQNGIFGENFYIIFKVEDTQNNLVSTSVKLIITDDMPASGFVNYIVNPVLSKRVDFVVSTEVNVRDVDADFIRIPSTSINLNFTEMNSNDDGKLWTEDYIFNDEGTYKLIIEMEDNNNVVTYDTLNMTVDFPDNQGAQMAMGSSVNTVYLEYPEHNYQNKMFFIEEKSIENPDDGLKKSTLADAIYDKKFKIKSGISAGEVLFTLRYNPDIPMDRYNSFYKITNGVSESIETFRKSNGEFIAYISEDCEVCFKPSTKAANEEILPENHLLCYPNPFNPTVNMKFLLKAQKKVELNIFNILGQKVYTDKQLFGAGLNEMKWHGTNNTGSMMPSGVYFVVLTRNHNPMKIQKVTLFK